MFLKKLFCKHKQKTCVSNIYGDLRNDIDCCSVWKCERCGKIFLRDEIEPSCYIVNFKLTHIIEKIKSWETEKAKRDTACVEEQDNQLTHQHESKGDEVV